MLVWKTLHVLSMVTMVTLFIGAEVFYAAAIRRRDGRALAFVQRTVEAAYIGILALAGIGLGVVFGLVAAATGGIDFTAGWLIVAYVLVVAFFVNSAFLGAKIVRAGKAAMAADAGASLDEIASDLRASDGVILVAINATIFAAIVIDMVVKPF